MSALLRILKNECDLAFRWARKDLPFFGKLAVGLFPVVSYVETYLDFSVGTTWFHLVGVAGMAPFAFRRVVYSEWKWLSVAYVLAVGDFFCFTFGLIVAFDATYARESGRSFAPAIVIYMALMYVFPQLCMSTLLVVLLWIFYTFLSIVLAIVASSQPNMSALFSMAPYMILSISLGVVFGELSRYSARGVQGEVLRTSRGVSQGIVVELGSLLSAIEEKLKQYRELLASLIAAYRARQDDERSEELTARQLRLIESAGSDISNELDSAAMIVDLLRANTELESVDLGYQGAFWASELADEALRRYPFVGKSERSLVELEMRDDFYLRGSKQLLVNVIFNLIRNAIYYCRKAGKGRIWLVVDGTRRSILVVDTGPGIAAESISHIFEPFFTTTETGVGSGLGLSFCRLVMRRHGGAIECESQYGEYTNFRLRFPIAEYEEDDPALDSDQSKEAQSV